MVAFSRRRRAGRWMRQVTAPLLILMAFGSVLWVLDDGGPRPLSGCAIKGNISFSGERIFHVPGDRYYEETKIDQRFGERWFCSIQEAIAAGWRRSKV